MGTRRDGDRNKIRRWEVSRRQMGRRREVSRRQMGIDGKQQEDGRKRSDLPGDGGGSIVTSGSQVHVGRVVGVEVDRFVHGV